MSSIWQRYTEKYGVKWEIPHLQAGEVEHKHDGVVPELHGAKTSQNSDHFTLHLVDLFICLFLSVSKHLSKINEHIFLKNIYYLFEKHSRIGLGRVREKDLLSSGSLPKRPQEANLGQVKAKNQVLHPGITRGWQLGHHLLPFQKQEQKAGWEAE